MLIYFSLGICLSTLIGSECLLWCIWYYVRRGQLCSAYLFSLCICDGILLMSPPQYIDRKWTFIWCIRYVRQLFSAYLFSLCICDGILLMSPPQYIDRKWTFIWCIRYVRWGQLCSAYLFFSLYLWWYLHWCLLLIGSEPLFWCMMCKVGGRLCNLSLCTCDGILLMSPPQYIDRKWIWVSYIFLSTPSLAGMVRLTSLTAVIS